MYNVELYARVRRACMVEGMSVREASRVFGLHRDTVRKMPAWSVPPGYRRQDPPRRLKLEPFSELQSHYRFEDRSGHPGKCNDKAKVEGMVSYVRRNFLVPVPSFHSFDALNAHLGRVAWSVWTPGSGATMRPSASEGAGPGRPAPPAHRAL